VVGPLFVALAVKMFKYIAYPISGLTAGFAGAVVYGVSYSSSVQRNDLGLPPSLYDFGSKRKDGRVPKVFLDGYSYRVNVPKSLKLSKEEVTTQFARSFFTSSVFSLERKILSYALGTDQTDDEILELDFKSPRETKIAGAFTLETRDECNAIFAWSHDGFSGKTLVGVSEVELNEFQSPDTFMDEYELRFASSVLMDGFQNDPLRKASFSFMTPFHRIYSRVLLKDGAASFQKWIEEKEVEAFKKQHQL